MYEVLLNQDVYLTCLCCVIGISQAESHVGPYLVLGQLWFIWHGQISIKAHPCKRINIRKVEK